MTDLSPDARALLASLAVSHEPPPDAAERVRARVAVQVAAPPPAAVRPSWYAVVGLGVVAVLVAWWSTRTPASVAPPVAAPRPVPAIVAPAPATAPVVVAPAPVEVPAPTVVAPTVAPAPRPAQVEERDDLPAELRLIQRAQTALAAGDAAGAQSALRTHARTFPRGHLAEEREALGVQVLCASGRTEEARRAGAAFVARHPGSPQVARVRRTCNDAH